MVVQWCTRVEQIEEREEKTRREGGEAKREKCGLGLRQVLVGSHRDRRRYQVVVVMGDGGSVQRWCCGG